MIKGSDIQDLFDNLEGAILLGAEVRESGDGVNLITLTFGTDAATDYLPRLQFLAVGDGGANSWIVVDRLQP